MWSAGRRFGRQARSETRWTILFPLKTTPFYEQKHQHTLVNTLLLSLSLECASSARPARLGCCTRRRPRTYSRAGHTLNIVARPISLRRMQFISLSLNSITKLIDQKEPNDKQRLALYSLRRTPDAFTRRLDGRWLAAQVPYCTFNISNEAYAHSAAHYPRDGLALRSGVKPPPATRTMHHGCPNAVPKHHPRRKLGIHA